MIRSACIERDDLRVWLDDPASGDEHPEWQHHLETCLHCQETLEMIAADQRLWSGVSRQLRDGPPASDQEPALHRLMSRMLGEIPLSSTCAESKTAIVDDNLLSFLQPTPDRPELLGLLDRYEVQQVIGRGGMGIVFRAFDPSLQRLVAIKVMAPQLAASASGRKRFLREARATAAVAHEHVITIYSVEEWRGMPYFVMQLVGGVSLQEKLDTSGSLELREILRIGMQTAHGLAAAHQHGLIHRDVKPGNILLENAGEVTRVKLTDFGLARAIEDASCTQSGVVAGTPHFMAPEQARGDSLDHRADIFSLGSVLYTCATGRNPFRASTLLGVLRRVSDEAPLPIRELNSDVPIWLERLINQMMTKQPEHRYSSASDVASLLEGCLAHLQHPNLYRLPELLESRRKTPRFAFAALFLIFATLLIAGTVLRFRTPNGTLVVELNDPNAKVQQDAKGITITGAGISEVHIDPSKQELRKSAAGVPEKTEILTIEKDGKTIVKASMEPDGRADAVALVPDAVWLTEVRQFTGHRGSVRTIAFSPDGRLLATGSGWPEGDRKVIVWDAASGKMMWTYDFGQERLAIEAGPQEKIGEVHSVATSPDGKFVAAGGVGGVVVLCDAKTGKLIQKLTGHKGTIYQLRFTPDGKFLIGASRDKNIHIWDLATGQQVKNLEGHTNWVRGIDITKDGKLMASCGRDNTVRLWNVAEGTQLRSITSFEVWPETIAFAPDGKTLLVGSNDLTLWDVGTGVRLQTFEPGNSSSINRVAFMPDGKEVLSVTYDGKLRVWNVADHNLIKTVNAHPNWALDVAVSPDGKVIATSGGARVQGANPNPLVEDFSIKLWSVSPSPK